MTVKSLAAELRPVRVNGISADAVDTELWHRLPEAERLAMFERIGARPPGPETRGHRGGVSLSAEDGLQHRRDHRRRWRCVAASAIAG
jgi:NAD(P)-dependent dehydrogenase (short-subunit alcohol dehydrogenase family)